MKRFLLLLLLQMPLLSVWGIGSYAVKDTLHVMTIAGLKLRAAPQLEAGAKTVLPYGAEVVVKELTSKHDSISEMPGYSIRGSWVKIESAHGDGYVFDGYLSAFKPPKITDKGEMGEDIETYLSRYKALSKRMQASKNPAEFNQVLEKGIKFSKRIAEDSSNYGRVIIADISLEEMYLISNALCRTAAATGAPVDYSDANALQFTINAQEITIMPASGTGLSIRMLRQAEKGGGGGGTIQYKEVRSAPEIPKE